MVTGARHKWRPAPLPSGAARSSTARCQNGPGGSTLSESHAFNGRVGGLQQPQELYNYDDHLYFSM
eukprot:6173188-Pleurochrysis_carterae.AAC.1